MKKYREILEGLKGNEYEGNIQEDKRGDAVVRIRDIVKKEGNLMSLRKPLERLGYKVSYVGEPFPVMIVQVGGEKFAIVNKRYADDPEFVEGNLAGGWLG